MKRVYDHFEKMDHPELLSPSPLPVLSRLDRLDHLLLLLEERHCLSEKHSLGFDIGSMKNNEDQRKTLASALEEVNQKGTLMKRLTLLENRVLELSVVMEEVEYTSRPRFSPIKMAEKREHKSSFSAITGQDENTSNNLQGVEACAGEGKSKGYRKDRRWRNVVLLRHKKWLGWFRMGC